MSAAKKKKVYVPPVKLTKPVSITKRIPKTFILDSSIPEKNYERHLAMKGAMIDQMKGLDSTFQKYRSKSTQRQLQQANKTQSSNVVTAENDGIAREGNISPINLGDQDAKKMENNTKEFLLQRIMDIQNKELNEQASQVTIATNQQSQTQIHHQRYGSQSTIPQNAFDKFLESPRTRHQSVSPFELLKDPKQIIGSQSQTANSSPIHKLPQALQDRITNVNELLQYKINSNKITPIPTQNQETESKKQNTQTDTDPNRLYTEAINEHDTTKDFLAKTENQIRILEKKNAINKRNQKDTLKLNKKSKNEPIVESKSIRVTQLVKDEYFTNNELEEIIDAIDKAEEMEQIEKDKFCRYKPFVNIKPKENKPPRLSLSKSVLRSARGHTDRGINTTNREQITARMSSHRAKSLSQVNLFNAVKINTNDKREIKTRLTQRLKDTNDELDTNLSRKKIIMDMKGIFPTNINTERVNAERYVKMIKTKDKESREISRQIKEEKYREAEFQIAQSIEESLASQRNSSRAGRLSLLSQNTRDEEKEELRNRLKNLFQPQAQSIESDNSKGVEQHRDFYNHIKKNMEKRGHQQLNPIRFAKLNVL